MVGGNYKQNFIVWVPYVNGHWAGFRYELKDYFKSRATNFGGDSHWV